MAGLKRSRGKRLILDIGSSTVRFCELSQTKSGYQLTRYAQKEYLIDPSLGEEAGEEIRREAVKELLKETKVRAKKVIFGVPGQSVFTRPRALPPVPEHKVTQIVRYEIRQQIPFDLDQIALDFQILGSTPAGGYDVLMAAIKVDVVERKLDIIRAIKKTIDVVDVCPLAAYNWFKYTGEFGDQGECVAMVDLGASTTDIVIERDGQLRFIRSLSIGGNNVTSAIAGAFGVSFAEAERLKRQRGAAPSGNPERDGKGGEVIGHVLSRLVAEINRSLAYFRSQPGGGTVSRIIVTGGGACLRNIVPYLQQQLGIEVRIGQPLAGLAIAPEAQEVNEHPEQAAVVLGLALRTLERVTVAINLIPPRIRQAARRREQAFYWAMSFFALVLIVASIVPVRAQQDKEVQQRNEALQQMILLYDGALAGDSVDMPSEFETALVQAKSRVGNLAAKEAYLNELWKGRQFWLKYLVAINEARPRTGGIWFTDIQTTLVGGEQGKPPAPAKPTDLQQVQAAAPVEAEPTEAELAAMDPIERQMITFRKTLAAASQHSADPNARFESHGFEGTDPQIYRKLSFGGPEGGPPAPVANGLTVIGYAENVDIILRFVEALEAQQTKTPEEGAPPVPGIWIEKGVYFDPSTVDMASIRELDAPRVDPASLNTGGIPPAPGEERIFTFRVDCQFAGPSFMPAFEKMVNEAQGFGTASKRRFSIQDRMSDRDDPDGFDGERER